ncbi:MAG TPA: hypothetical protein VHP37_24320 [Burkholderiales bacterium]|nr:hypothetical protein [Burkholderiales bacterium]
MEYKEFVEAYHAGRIRVDIDRKGAARFVSRRLLLPLIMMPILGVGTALAIIGWIWTGLAIIAVGTIVPMFIRVSAPNFVMTQSLHDARFYSDAYRAGIMHLIAVSEERQSNNPATL